MGVFCWRFRKFHTFVINSLNLSNLETLIFRITHLISYKLKLISVKLHFPARFYNKLIYSQCTENVVSKINTYKPLKTSLSPL